MSINKQKVLICIDWYLPAFKAGGPVQSIANIVEKLGDFLTLYIVCSDRDLGDKVGYPEIQTNKWIAKENYFIQYLSPKNRSVSNYRTIFKETSFDTVYFNSIFSVPFTIIPLLIAKKYVAKVIVAPRGMLGAGGLNLKPLKKKVFLKIARSVGLFKNIHWHATVDIEKDAIKKHFGINAQCSVIPNIPTIQKKPYLPKEKKEGYLKLLFVSRISKIKNLIYALELLQEIEIGSITLDIIGPIEDKLYWETCMDQISNLPPNINTQYLGAIPNNELMELISTYHFMILPTFHENYGHVIAESFIHGCPVIISEYTPWHNLFEKKLGWDIELSMPNEWIKTINECVNMDQQTYNLFSQNTYDYGKQISNNQQIVEDTKKLLQ